MNDIGDVRINSPKVSYKSDEKQATLLHVPSGRMALLDELAKSLWEKLERGITNIATLVDEHSKSYNVPQEVAAFQVISFLDELRAHDYVAFKLSQERETAPLLDIPIDDLSPDQRKAIEREPLPPKDSLGRRIVMVERPRQDMQIRELRRIAESATSADLPEIDKIVTLEDPNSELTSNKIRNISDMVMKGDIRDLREATIIDRPRTDVSVKDLIDAHSFKVPTTAARRLVIIIIADGVIIIVIVSGPGPTFGKSRSACKTACV